MEKDRRHSFNPFGIFVIGIFLSGVFVFGSRAQAMIQKPREFPIQVRVDFGPAGIPAHEERIYIEEGTSPKEAISQVFPVLSGKTCCSFREIMSINGVSIDPAKNRWWTCWVNRSKKGVSPNTMKLRPGDHLEWKYIEDSQ